jgi:N-acetylglutamate synthase-like GNAT family acetyltransferase/DNA-binding MarR family transcriptional regulator
MSTTRARETPTPGANVRGSGPGADLLSRLGELGLASRMRRVSDDLFRDVSRIYHELDIDFEARWFPLLFALREDAPQGVTELARSLNLTHPAVNQMAAEMQAKGLLLSARDPGDSRRRLLRLSVRGQQIASRLDPIWREIRGANADLLGELRAEGFDLLPALSRLESLLIREGMYERIRRRLGAAEACPAAGPSEIRDRLEILPYKPAYKRHFDLLNREWLEERFRVEPADEAILKHPHETIVKRGGMVFFARMDGEIVGTCALIPHGEGIYELAKMAVTRSVQGRGIGRRLAEAVLEDARARSARMVFLETSPRMIAVRRWYARLGFRQVDVHPLGGSKYARKSVAMVLDAVHAADADLNRRRR